MNHDKIREIFGTLEIIADDINDLAADALNILAKAGINGDTFNDVLREIA